MPCTRCKKDVPLVPERKSCEVCWLRDKARIKVRRARRKGPLKQWLREIKSKPCTDCGETFDPRLMHFDHEPGTKKYGIGEMISRGHARKSIEAELTKCELVCMWCHAKRTGRRSKGLQNHEKKGRI